MRYDAFPGSHSYGLPVFGCSCIACFPDSGPLPRTHAVEGPNESRARRSRVLPPGCDESSTGFTRARPMPGKAVLSSSRPGSSGRIAPCVDGPDPFPFVRRFLLLRVRTRQRGVRRAGVDPYGARGGWDRFDSRCRDSSPRRISERRLLRPGVGGIVSPTAAETDALVTRPLRPEKRRRTERASESLHIERSLVWSRAREARTLRIAASRHRAHHAHHAHARVAISWNESHVLMTSKMQRRSKS
jgi:hypothetical protein